MTELPEELVKARQRANSLHMEAEAARRAADRARQRARSAEGHYEAMLRAYQGEQSLPLEFEAVTTHTFADTSTRELDPLLRRA